MTISISTYLNWNQYYWKRFKWIMGDPWEAKSRLLSWKMSSHIVVTVLRSQEPETGSQVVQLVTWWDGYNNLSVVNSCKNILGENKFNYVLLAWASLEPSMRQTKFSISFEYLHFSLKLIWMLAVLLSGNLKCNWFKLKFSQHRHTVSSLCPVCNTFVICYVYSRVTPLY